MSIYSVKQAASQTNLPWQQSFAPGLGLNSSQSLANLFNLYNLYQGQSSFTVSVATNLPTVQDGPIHVFRFGTLTLNAALSVTNRCRGLVILCDALVVNSGGKIDMSARGAAGNAQWANQDILVPNNALFSGKNTSFSQFQQWLAANNFFIFDPTLFAVGYPGMGDVTANYASWPSGGMAVVSAAGCGTGAGSYVARCGAGGSGGSPGYAGVSGGTGGGGGGSATLNNTTTNVSAIIMGGGQGRVWGGGSGGASAQTNAQYDASAGGPGDAYGGAGGSYVVGGTGIGSGGSGNPPGSGAAAGTGGVLMIFCRGNVGINSGGIIQSNGSSGNSGGGSVSILYSGTYANNGTVQCVGGGNGGAGSAQSKLFSTMGY